MACQPEAESARQVDPATDAARLKTALHERKNQQGLTPFSDSALQAMLPARLKGFAFVDTKSGSFQEQFSEVERVYFQENGNYLHAKLADYEAAPEAFEQIWQAYEQVLQRDDGQLTDRHIQHFCWQRVDSMARVSERECGLVYRFHLQFRSNHPKADSLFDYLQEAISLPTPTP